MAKILFIDDSPNMLDLFSLVLKMQNFEVDIDTTTDGIMERIFAYQPDLILLDVRLINEDGRDACKKIKTNEVTKSIPVILTSCDDMALSDFKKYGADDILIKPFDIIELITKVISKIKKAHDSDNH